MEPTDTQAKETKEPYNTSGPVHAHGMKVWVERDLCIGAATCVAVAPLTFTLDDEAKAIILETIQTDTVENIIDAAKSCPVQAIIIEDEHGKRIYPS